MIQFRDGTTIDEETCSRCGKEITRSFKEGGVMFNICDDCKLVEARMRVGTQIERERDHYKALCEELRGALKQIRHELGRHYGPGPHCTCGQTGMGNICIAALKD